MDSKLLPRYLAVAHYIHQQDCMVSVRDVAAEFNITKKMACDDFYKIRQRKDIIIIEQQNEKCGNFTKILLKVVNIYPYTLDKRMSPRCATVRSDILSNMPTKPSITWDMLVSLPWHRLYQLNYSQVIPAETYHSLI
jgi:hypothetical protein